MAKEPADAVMRILQLIQKTLADHGTKLNALPKIERRLDEIYEGMVTSLGMAANANIRHDRAEVREDEIQRELKDIKRRIKALEEKV